MIIVPPIFQPGTPNRNGKIYPESIFIRENFSLTMRTILGSREDILLTYHPEHGQMFSRLGEILCNVLATKGDQESLDRYKDLTITGRYASGHAGDRLDYSNTVANTLARIYSDSNNLLEISILQDELLAMKGQFTTTDMYKTLVSAVKEFMRNALN